MAQTKALTGAIIEMHCSIVGEMPANCSKIHQLGSVLVNSAVRHNCGNFEKMLSSQSRKGTDRAENRTSFFS